MHRSRYSMAAFSITLAFGCLPGEAAAMQGVEFQGMTFDGAPEMTLSPEQQQATDAFETFCDNYGNTEDLEAMYTGLEVQIAGMLAEVGMGAVTEFFPDSGEIDDMIDAVKKECDRDRDDDNFGFTTIIYSQCRMIMDGMTGQLDIKIPAGSDGHMIVFDGTEGAKVNLTQRVGEVSELVGQGWSSGIEWQTGPGQTIERAGYPATEAQFEYSVGMGAGSGAAMEASQQAAEGQLSTEQYLGQIEGTGAGQLQALEMLGGMVSNKVTGWGYFSTEVPGIDIVRSFYSNFAENVAPGGNVGSFFGGMINSSVGLLERGIPLEMHTTLETKLMGKTKITGESMSAIYEAKLVNLPSDWCTRSFIDESRLRDIDAEMQQAFGAAGQGAGGASGSAAGAPGMTAEQAAQMNQGMESLSQAMQQMSPEQQQALRAMGLESMIPGMAGDPAGQAAATPAASTQSPPSGSGPSSAALTTDNMTQSVQNHLQALGYDPGNTNGDLSTETIIAISQFQAETGMKVTGEVTPQLLGILGAKVDSGQKPGQ